MTYMLPHENAAKYIANRYADQEVLYDQSGYTNVNSVYKPAFSIMDKKPLI